MNPPHALIIDDDDDLSFMLGEIFRSRNYSVAVANNLFNAKIAIKNLLPSVVILDYTLPDGRGTEIIPDLNQCCPSAKIFLITGDYDNIDEDYQNVTRFIRKPFSLAHFRSIMEEYLVEA